MNSGKKVSTFSERFSELCEGNSFTDVELSRALKVSKQTISAWKNGTRSPKEPTIITIAQHFHVTVEWLMGFDVSRFNQDQQENVPRPKTIEARIVSAWIDDLPKEDRERVLAVFLEAYARKHNGNN